MGGWLLFMAWLGGSSAAIVPMFVTTRSGAGDGISRSGGLWDTETGDGDDVTEGGGIA